jgi:hypothetical protein
MKVLILTIEKVSCSSPQIFPVWFLAPEDKKTKPSHGIINIRNPFPSEVGTGVKPSSFLPHPHIPSWAQAQAHWPDHHQPLGSPRDVDNHGVHIYRCFCVPGSLGCKSFFYLHKFLRGLSICATCLLSVLQAITLNPEAPVWQSSNINPCITACVPFFSYGSSVMAFSAHFSFSAVDNSNFTTYGLIFVTESCTVLPWVTY